MMDKGLSMAAVLFAMIPFPGASQAGVIYNWITATNSFDLKRIEGQIEVTDSAWLSGNVNVQLNNQGQRGSTFPDSPVLKFELTVNGAEFQILPRAPTRGTIGSGEFSLDVVLNFNGRQPATGEIVANNTDSDIDFGSRGADTLWTITNFSSRNPQADCFLGPCSAATGRWQIDASTIPEAAQVDVAAPLAD